MENETKTNWFKSHLALCIIIAVVLVAAVVGGYFIFANKADTPEKIAEKYISAMNEGSADKIIEITDLKGSYAWEKCGEDPEKFEEEYKNVSDSDVNTFKDKYKQTLETSMAMMKAFGGLKTTAKEIGKPEELSKDLYKIKVVISMEALGQEQEQDSVLVVYKGKYIGNLSK